MSEPFLGEIRMFSFSYAPRGWAFCQGQTLPVNQYQALFAIIGVSYGGNGTTNFMLPDFRGRLPYHWNVGGQVNSGALTGLVVGSIAGTETVTLSANQIPTHTHIPAAVNPTVSTTPNTPTPANAFWGAEGTANTFSSTAGTAPNNSLDPSAIATVGANLPHENRPPYLTLNFCICMSGIFPSRG